MKRRWSKSFINVRSFHRAIKDLGFFVFLFCCGLSIALSLAFPESGSRLRASVTDMLVPVAHSVSQPIQNMINTVQNIGDITELKATNERLKKENARLREWYQTALKLEADNKSLKHILNIKLEEDHKFITTTVLIDLGRSFVKSLLISSSQKDGVEKGQAVISGDGLVGRVIEAGEKTSRVLLVTDINSRVPVLIENSNQHAILAGANDEFPHLLHLPQDSIVNTGARIVTSGYGGVFPKGLPVGQVLFNKEVIPVVKLFSDLDRLVYLRVVQKADDIGLSDLAERSAK